MPRLATPRGVLLLVACAAVAASAAAADPPPPDPGSARAVAVLRPFQERLQAALKEGLANGPEAAIDACRAQAPAIAAELSTSGAEVGRTSHRLRNPANAPRAWVAPLLAKALADPEAAKPESVELAGGAIGYVEPIRMQPLCLACHGEALAPAVAGRLRELYPRDRATGFRVGDLRGLYWVELAPAD